MNVNFRVVVANEKYYYGKDARSVTKEFSIDVPDSLVTINMGDMCNSVIAIAIGEYLNPPPVEEGEE